MFGATAKASLRPTLNNRMKINEIMTSQKPPLNPAQARLNQLRKNQELAKQALAREKHQQQLKKAQERVSRLNASKIRPMATQSDTTS